MAFDQVLNIFAGPPGFSIFWSSRRTPSGHYVGAFVYGNVGGLQPGFNVQLLVQQAIPNPRLFPNAGFFVVGQPPTAAQGQAFWASLQQVIATYPQWNSGRGIGGMILWLPALGSFTRASTFGLFTPAPPSLQTPLLYQLDQGSHLLFDAGGGNRLLAVNPNGPAAQLTAAGPMTIALTSPGGPLGLSFGASPDYPGLAVSPIALTVELDVSQPYAGCVGVANAPVGPGLRNFEFGFEHGFVPQGGLGSSGDPLPFRMFHPLLDSSETLQNATVTAWLNPLIPTQVAAPPPTTASYNTIALARAGTPFVSGYRSRLGDRVTLAPANALFVATPCLTSRAYFAPSGTFTMGVQGSAAPLSSLIGGLSAVEYVAAAAGDAINFVAGQSAGIAYTTAKNPDGTSYTSFAPASPPDDTASKASLAQLMPAAARNYVCQGEMSPIFISSNFVPTTDPLGFAPLPLTQVSASAPISIPLLPQASLDFGGGGTAGNAGTTPAMAAAFERGFAAPVRLRALEAGPQATNTRGVIWTVTPQGYILQFDNGVLTSITLGSIDPATGSSGSLAFVGTTQNPLSKNLRNAFLANQQFIVATCLTADLQNNVYQATADLSGWTFKLDLPTQQNVVPGAYQTVLIVKSASASIKSLAAEPYAWTAYGTFNNAGNDPQGIMLSNWLVAYLAQAEALYAQGNGLTSLETFVTLINDADWNGYLYLQVPIDIGALDPSIAFLTSGIDASQFYAHHVGCALNHTGVSGGAYQANSAYLGLVHYLRSGTDPNNITGTPPYIPLPASTKYDFQLLTLEASFENSALVDFRSSAQLLMNVLFGDSVVAKSPDPNVSATNALMIYGSSQTLDGVVRYVFATSKSASSTFFLSSAAFERIEIDRATVTVGNTTDVDGFRTATFMMSGWLGLLPSGKFDVLSYAAIPLAGLELDMKFKSGTSSFALSTGKVALSDMPQRAAGTDEVITAASAAANIIYRTSSLAAGFPLAAPTLIGVTDPSSSQTPATMGYRSLSTQVSLGGSSISAPWYGLEFDLPLGGGGALSSGSLFTARMLFAWAPNGTGAIAVAPYFMLEGPGGANLTLEIEGVLKLGAAGIYLMKNSKDQFVLELASLGITVLSQSFPPAGSTNLLLGGVGNGNQRYLGWFGAYVKKA